MKRTTTLHSTDAKVCTSLKDNDGRWAQSLILGHESHGLSRPGSIPDPLNDSVILLRMRLFPRTRLMQTIDPMNYLHTLTELSQG